MIRSTVQGVIPFVMMASVGCSRHPEPTTGVASSARIVADDSPYPSAAPMRATGSSIDAGSTGLEWTKIEPIGDLGATLRLEARSAYGTGRRPILMVTAPWCSVCKSLKAALSERHSHPQWAKIRILEVDGDTYTERLQGMGLKVLFLPTLARFTREGSFEEEIARPKDGVEGLLRTLKVWAQ